ncbi:MAG: hypothetical protein R3A10_14220 [Caldilineaceae bacterium]
MSHLVSRPFIAAAVLAAQPGFGTLLHIILEQQRSLAGLGVKDDRLCAAVDPAHARGRAGAGRRRCCIGFSRQKTAYAHTGGGAGGRRPGSPRAGR